MKNKNNACCHSALHPNYLQFHHLVEAEAFAINSICSTNTVRVSFSFLSNARLASHLALDRGACHPHTVIIPELTSPLSIELLRRWRGHKILCRETHPCGLRGNTPKWTLLGGNKPPAHDTVESELQQVSSS